MFGSIVGGALGLAGSLFGGDDSTSSPTQTTTQEPWGPTVPYLEGILGDASSLYAQGGFAPLPNELQYLGLENILGYGEDVLPGLISSAQQSWLTGLDPAMDPYVQSMIAAEQYDILQDFTRDILPAISSEAVSTGGYGGSRQGIAEGIAAEGALEAMTDAATTLLSDAYAQGLQQQQAAWAQTPSMLGIGYLPGETQQSVGQTYQGYAGLPAANLQGYANLVTPMAGQGYTSTGLNPYYVDPVSQAMSGAMAGAGLGQQVGSWFGGSGSNSGSVNWSDPNINPLDYHFPTSGYTPGLFG